ncbi:MAG: ribokinase [Propionibacteriaceae bacterium]|nr:ribokinase [Propionibacteriaceae bacterium]
MISQSGPQADSDPLTTLRGLSGRVAVVGSANVDFTVLTETLPRPGQTVPGSPLRTLPGGKSANQAVQAALLGADVRFVGCLGGDASGDLLHSAMSQAGVDMSDCGRVEGATGSAIITVDAQAENTIVVSPGANASLTEGFVRRHSAAIAGASTLGLCLETPLDGVLAAARVAGDHGVAVLLNLSPYREVPAELLELTDLLVVNEGELSDLLATPHPAEAIARDRRTQSAIAAGLADRGVERAVVTLGGAGSLIIQSGAATAWPALAIPRVVDTTGCGDSFLGALLAALASGSTLLAAADLASLTAGLAATRPGAQASYADRTQLAELLAQRP